MKSCGSGERERIGLRLVFYETKVPSTKYSCLFLKSRIHIFFLDKIIRNLL